MASRESKPSSRFGLSKNNPSVHGWTRGPKPMGSTPTSIRPWIIRDTARRASSVLANPDLPSSARRYARRFCSTATGIKSLSCMPAWTSAKITDARRGFVFSRWRLIKPALFLVCLAPMALLIAAIVNGQLSANPLEDIRDSTGIWTLRFLILTLSISPLRQITGWRSLIRLRRMIGLFAFYYAALHFITYVWLDQFFAFREMAADLTKRRFIMAGYLSFVLLVPLALTSTKKWILRL